MSLPVLEMSDSKAEEYHGWFGICYTLCYFGDMLSAGRGSERQFAVR